MESAYYDFKGFKEFNDICKEAEIELIIFFLILTNLIQTMKTTFLLCSTLLFSFFCSAQTVSLFNGKDLSGWHIDVPDMDNNPEAINPFIVRDGNLVSLGNPQGHLITDKTYENYILEVEYRFTGEPGNCGVLVHASTPRVLYDMFPKSIEVQMQSGDAGDFWCIGENIKVDNMVERRGPKESWGVTEGKKRRIKNLTENSEKPLGEWNEMKIEVKGNQIQVWVNGELVNQGYDATAQKGQIAVQAEGAEVEFRKLDLTKL